jgi:hypothetical protein
MSIGIHDHNHPSALTPMVALAKEKGKKLIPIDDLSTLGGYGIYILIINPTANPDWSKYVEVIKAYPNMRFIFSALSAYGKGYFHDHGLNDYENAEIMDNEALCKLLQLK